MKPKLLTPGTLVKANEYLELSQSYIADDYDNCVGSTFKGELSIVISGCDRNFPELLVLTQTGILGWHFMHYFDKVVAC